MRLIDPTRTVSRNHAAISFDEDGSMWLEDFGSLNGTAIYAGDTVELDRVRVGRLERFGRGRPGLGGVSLEVVDGAEDLAGGFVVGVPARFRRGRIR